MTRPVWSYVLDLSVWTLKKAHMISCTYNQLPGSLSPDYKYLHARQIPHQLSFSYQSYLTV